MKIRDIMTKDVHVCSASDSLNIPAGIMWDHDVGCVPVVGEGGRTLIGIITDRDICMASYLEGKRPADIEVSRVMAKQVVSCHPNQPLSEVEALMRSAQVRRVPVIDTDGSLIGIVSLADLSHAVETKPETERPQAAVKLALTLGAIARPRASSPAKQPEAPAKKIEKIAPPPAGRPTLRH